MGIRRNRNYVTLLASALAAGGFGMGHNASAFSGFNLPNNPNPSSPDTAVGRRTRFRKGSSRKRHNNGKPHQGAREKARRRERGEGESAIRQAHRWASWKKGRSVNVVDGMPFCIPANG